MAEIVARVNAVAPTWNLLGFLTPDAPGNNQSRSGHSWLGVHGDLPNYPGAFLVPDNEWPHSLDVPPERLVSLIDPSVFLSRTATVGAGCVLYPHCFVGLNARIGNAVFCLSGTVINHDVVVEEHVVIASGVSLAGSVHTESDCYLGQACTVRQNVRIGRGSVIGMGAVVTRDVPPNCVIVGNPGRKLRDTR